MNNDHGILLSADIHGPWVAHSHISNSHATDGICAVISEFAHLFPACPELLNHWSLDKFFRYQKNLAGGYLLPYSPRNGGFRRQRAHIAMASSEILQIYLAELRRHPLITPEEEAVLATRIKEGDPEAFERMVNANLRLVISIASEYRNLGVDFLDIISEGNIGLTQAIYRFDPTAGAKLSTYASYWIKQRIRRFVANYGRTIRIPLYVTAAIWTIRKASEAYEAVNGHPPSEHCLSQLTGYSIAKLRRLSVALPNLVSLDVEGTDEDESGLSLHETTADPKSANSLMAAIRAERLEMIEELLQHLQPRERDVIERRFGLRGLPETLDDIGRCYGVTRERIRQIEAMALRNLQGRLYRKENPFPLRTSAMQRKLDAAKGTVSKRAKAKKKRGQTTPDATG